MLTKTTAVAVDHTCLNIPREPTRRIRSLQKECLTKKEDVGVVWIENQPSTYDDSTLLNPFTAFYHGIKTVAAISSVHFIWFEHIVYSIFWSLMILSHLFIENELVPSAVVKIISKLGTLAAFILAFYLKMAMGRWWRLRTVGVGGLTAFNIAIAVDLGIVHNTIKKDGNFNHLLEPMLKHIDKIKRYSAASLYFHFLKNRQFGFTYNNIRKYGILTLKETKFIRDLNSDPAAYMYTLIKAELTKIAHLIAEAKPVLHQAMLWFKWQCLCQNGLNATKAITAQLGVQVPLDYATAVRFLVQIDNIGRFIVFGSETTKYIKDSGDDQSFMIVMIVLEFLLLHFIANMFNLLMIIGIELENPFNDGRISFPGWRYVNAFLSEFEVLLNIDQEIEGEEKETNEQKI